MTAPADPQADVQHDPGYWSDPAVRSEAMAAPFTGHFAQATRAGQVLAPGTRQLDIAAGACALLLQAADLGATVTAIDFASGMVTQVAGQNHPRCGQTPSTS